MGWGRFILAFSVLRGKICLGGDSMVHKETKRLVAGAKTAVLFIHGINGTPNHFDMLTHLVPDTMTLHNLLLDGHGKMPLDFGRTSMKKWENQVQAAVDALAATHEEILIVGHSMGTLFAMEQAMRCHKVKRLFLIAVPVTPWLGRQYYSNVFNMYFDRVRADDRYVMAAIHCYGIGPDKNLLHYYRWTPRFLELFQKVHKTRKLLPHLKTPCTAYQSRQDEMVSRRSIPYLQKHAPFPVRVLEKSSHTYYDPTEEAYLQKEFLQFINENAPE